MTVTSDHNAEPEGFWANSAQQTTVWLTPIAGVPKWGFNIDWIIFTFQSAQSFIDNLTLAFHPQGYVQAEGKLPGQQGTGKDTLCALQGFPICLPWSSFYVALFFMTEMKQIHLWESKSMGEGTRFLKKHTFQTFISPTAPEQNWNIKADFFFWNFILLWKPLFKKSVLGYICGAGRGVHGQLETFCKPTPYSLYHRKISCQREQNVQTLLPVSA